MHLRYMRDKVSLRVEQEAFGQQPASNTNSGSAAEEKKRWTQSRAKTTFTRQSEPQCATRSVQQNLFSAYKFTLVAAQYWLALNTGFYVLENLPSSHGVSSYFTFPSSRLTCTQHKHYSKLHPHTISLTQSSNRPRNESSYLFGSSVTLSPMTQQQQQKLVGPFSTVGALAESSWWTTIHAQIHSMLLCSISSHDSVRLTPLSAASFLCFNINRAAL